MPELDTVVIGAGPAGATAARLLAMWGHSVTVLTKPASEQHAKLAVSLPPSCRRLFERLGVLDAVEAAGFFRTLGNTVWWGESEGRVEDFTGGDAGYEVVLGDLAPLLLGMTIGTGVGIQEDATVRSVDLMPKGEPGARVYYESGGRRRELLARWVLDCSGRAGVIARQESLRVNAGHDTLALAGIWRRDGGWTDLPNETHTLVESYEDGWAWSVPVSHTERHFTVMVDPHGTGLSRGGELEPMYRAELAKTVQFNAFLDGATLKDGPWGLGASPYGARQVSGGQFLLVGDAACFINPLSSFGVKKALASAWLAAVVVNTILKTPQMAAHALEFYERREREVYDSYRRLSARYFGEAAMGSQYSHPFWWSRAHDVDELDVVAGGPADVVVLRSDPDVLGAFAALKEGESINLRPTSALERVERPGILGNEIVLLDSLVAPWVPDGLRYLRGVDLVKLVEMAPEHEQVPDLYDAYNRACPPVVLPDFLGALSVLLGKGMLENRASVA